MDSNKVLDKSVAALQIIGAREAQEDALDEFSIDDKSSKHTGEHLLLLADGMGGHVGGATASNTVIKVFAEAYVTKSVADIRQALRTGLDEANFALEDMMEIDPTLSDMGTTLIAATVSGNDFYWISVGDSLLWLFRDGELQRLNADHSMAPILEGLVEIGRMSEEDAANDPRKNQLRSAVTGDELTLVDLCPEPIQLQKGDLLILASDGVETVSIEDLEKFCVDAKDKPPHDLAQNIMDTIERYDQEYQDNVSLIIYQHTD